MTHCKYCASTDTKLDAFGYCVAYHCFDRAGLRSQLRALARRASNLILVPKSGGQVGSVVPTSLVFNPYSPRNREANNIMRDATRLFGFVPRDVLKWIDPEDQLAWDRNVRW